MLFSGALTLAALPSRKEERRAQLAKAAQEMKESGKTETVFDDSSYAVSEDKSPNIHTVGPLAVLSQHACKGGLSQSKA